MFWGSWLEEPPEACEAPAEEDPCPKLLSKEDKGLLAPLPEEDDPSELPKAEVRADKGLLPPLAAGEAPPELPKAEVKADKGLACEAPWEGITFVLAGVVDTGALLPSILNCSGAFCETASLGATEALGTSADFAVGV